MEIIKKTSILVKTRRRFVVSGLLHNEIIQCGQCAGQMLPAQSAADFFSVSSRIIYRLIEQESIHYIETDVNEIFVCPISVENVLEQSE